MELKNQIICGDSEIVLKELPDNSVDIIWTSPVYKDEDGFNLVKLANIFHELYGVLKPNSLFYLNFGSLQEQKERPFIVLLEALNCGFKLNETIIWQKVQYSPIQGNKSINNVVEYVFMLYKGGRPNLNRMSIGVEYEDKTNAKRYNKGVNLKCRANVWKIGYETIQNKNQKLHPLRAPVRLVEDCIKLSGLKKGVVLDCFGGSGTTGLAAKNLGLDYVLIEQNPKYIEIAKKRLNYVSV